MFKICSWNVVENGVMHHKPKLLKFYYTTLYYINVLEHDCYDFLSPLDRNNDM